jgi:serine/tyrosine/threonine adenylyltransferase
MASPMRTHLPDWHLEHTYQQALPPQFFASAMPAVVSEPRLIHFNVQLARSLGLYNVDIESVTLASQLSGRTLPEGAKPIAQAYAGHQFGHFTMLGDGRAILLGEQITPSGDRFDIQLKGAGQTHFSRRGDGRATLSAMLREYVMSEAMHHLGIPTTRSLAVVATGLPVYRERVQPGAVLTRVASSHLRGGTFEFARQFVGSEGLQQLLDYAIGRHYPEVKGDAQPAVAFVRRVMLRQIDLIVEWMRVGFIHGVMNTDNMSIAGETIDYGPCAFMNSYNLRTVFSSIDEGSRYAFGNQPAIAQWNLAVLASALLPLVHPEREQAAPVMQELINDFVPIYEARWFVMMCSKLGLTNPNATDDGQLIQDLLDWMEREQADYTLTFRVIAQGVSATDPAHYQSNDFARWHQRWSARITGQAGGLTAAQTLMQRANPVFIPRNHMVEAALSAAESGDLEPFNTLLAVCERPYETQAGREAYANPPAGGDMGYQTFCGT